MSGERHKKAFKHWFARLPAPTKLLVNAVLECIVPELEQRGFVWVDDLMGLGKGFINRADLIAMQREFESGWDMAAIDFGKKQQPIFTICFRKWFKDEIEKGEIWFPHFLTKWKSDTASAKEFGFSRFDPFVSQARCEALAQEVVGLLEQMDRCFEIGICGPNVSEAKFIGVRKNDEASRDESET